MFRFRKRRGASSRTIVRTPGQWTTSVSKHRLRWLGTALALAGVGAGLHWAGQQMLDPARFPLRHVRFEGELRNLDTNDLQQLVQNFLGQNFFSLDIAALHTAVAANPWIESVAVRRLWPDSIEVKFYERTPFAYWGSDEMVDVHSKRFHPNHIRQTGPWPHLAGPARHEQNVIRAYREASSIVAKVGLQITRLTEDERRAWWIVFDNGIEVNVGREQLAPKLRRFVDVYPRMLSGRFADIAVVDLRYVNGFAVRWKNSAPTTHLSGKAVNRLTPFSGDLHSPRPSGRRSFERGYLTPASLATKTPNKAG